MEQKQNQHSETLSSFINIAESEHEHITRICNLFSLLSHSISEISKDPPPIVSTSKTSEERVIRRKGAHHLTLDYKATLENISRSHDQLRRALLGSLGDEEDDVTLHLLRQKMKDHVELGDRVIQTCVENLGDGGGPNSIAVSSSMHEARIVALAALQASIHGLKQQQQQFLQQ